MLVHQDYKTYVVMGQEIHIISDDLGPCRNTVAEIGDLFYYMGDEQPTVSAAVFAWQDVHGRDLSTEELRQVLIDNHLTSQAV
jgi:hypothetical protein